MATLATEDILDRAHARAQRRFKKVAAERVYTDWNARTNQLWRQAERLVDALLTELAWANTQNELERLQLNDPDAPDYLTLMVAAEAEVRSVLPPMQYPPRETVDDRNPFESGEDDEDEWTDRESQPEFNGAFA